MTTTSAVPQRPPTALGQVAVPAGVAIGYSTQAAYAGPPATYDRHAPAPSHNRMAMQVAEVPLASHYPSSRHIAPMPTIQPSPVIGNPPPPAKQPATSNASDPSVRVDNFDPGLTKTDILTIFNRFGHMVSHKIQQQKDSRGRVRSISVVVTYSTGASATRAVQALNGRRNRDRRLTATFVTSDQGRQHPSAGRLVIATSSSSSQLSRHRARGESVENRQGQQEGRNSTRGPCIVNGARGTGRRRHEVDSRDRGSSSDDESDSDASDEERENRRRHSTGRCSSVSEGECPLETDR